MHESAIRYQKITQTNFTDYTSYLNRPISFAIEVLGLSMLTGDQRRILRSIRDNPETNVPSCHGSGKTKVGAIACLWWIFAVRGLAVTTAPTERQVKELLWSEIRSLYDTNRDKLGGDRGALSLRFTETARGYGFSSRDYDSNSFQGIHAKRLLVIEDEACGISPPVDDGAMSCATGEENRILRIGNPISPGTPFEAACKREKIRIPAWNHPNVAWAYIRSNDGIHRLKEEVRQAIAPDGTVLPQSRWPDWCPRDVIPGAISIRWIEDIRDKKQEGSAFWQSRVEGEFPQDNQSSIIPRSLFAQARNLYDSNPQYWENIAKASSWGHGLDVGDGGDPHALASWQGELLRFVKIEPTIGDMQDVGRATKLARSHLLARIGLLAVDRGGVGAGSLSTLLEEGLSAIGVHWGQGSEDKLQYENLKAQQFWELRQALLDGEAAIAPLGDEEESLQDEFASIFWYENAKGKICIEPKEATKKKLGFSPNRADATVLGYWALRMRSHYEEVKINIGAKRDLSDWK